MFKPLRLIRPDTKIPFAEFRLTAFTFSFLLIMGSIFSLLVYGLNFGIDFRGGILMEVRSEKNVGISEIRAELEKLELGEVNIQRFGKDTDILIRIQRQDGAEKEQIAAIELVKETLGSAIDY